MLGAQQHRLFHAFNVHLEQVQAIERERVDAHHRHLMGAAVIDGLPNELVLRPRLQLQAAKRRRQQIIGLGDVHHPGTFADGAVAGTDIEAVVEDHIAREGIKNLFLRLKRMHMPPVVHAFGPFDGVHANIGAAIGRHHTRAEMLFALVQQAQDDLHFLGVEAGGLHELKTHAVTALRVDHAVVVAVDDQAAVGRRQQHKRGWAFQESHGAHRSI